MSVVRYNTHGRVSQHRVLAKTDFSHRVVVPIHHLSGKVAFDLVFFGIPIEDFYVVPGGADPIRKALTRRHLNPDDFVASMFEVRRGDNVYIIPAERMGEPIRSASP